MITFTVAGKPQQKGSKRAFVQGGRAIVVDDNKAPLRNWENAVASAAAEAMNGSGPTRKPVRVQLHFRFLRPKSHFGTGRNADVVKDSAPGGSHAQKPDIDKLARAALDAMSGVVFVDDAQVAELLVRKNWVREECAGLYAEVLEG